MSLPTFLPSLRLPLPPLGNEAHKKLLMQREREEEEEVELIRMNEGRRDGILGGKRLRNQSIACEQEREREHRIGHATTTLLKAKQQLPASSG